MKIAIRVDTTLKIGYGHISRCINLAKELKKQTNCKIYFLTICHDKNYLRKIKEQNFKICLLNSKKIYDQKSDALHSNEFLKKYKPDLLILDHYKLGIYWERLSKKNIKKLFVIDDLYRQHKCEFFLNQNLASLYRKKIYNKFLNKETIKLLGPKFSLIDNRFNFFKKKRKTNSKKNTILINFGSYDNHNMTCKILNYLLNFDLSNFNIKIVLDKNFNFKHQLNKITKNIKSIKVFYGVKNLIRMTFMSDICFGAGGVNNIERMCLGKINYVISTDKNQIENCKILSKKKCIIYIGHYLKINNKILKKKINSLENNNKHFNFIRKNASNLVDGKGTLRVANFIKKKIKVND